MTLSTMLTNKAINSNSISLEGRGKVEIMTKVERFVCKKPREKSKSKSYLKRNVSLIITFEAYKKVYLSQLIMGF